QVMHVEIGYPRDVEAFATSLGPAISPDGQTVAMVGVRDGLRRVFIRRLDRAESAELPDTAGAQTAGVSPHTGSGAGLSTPGRVTGMGLANQQRKLLTCGVDIALPITWSQAGILFSRGGALWIVAADGSAERPLTMLDRARHEVAHLNAVVLHGGRRVVFT